MIKKIKTKQRQSSKWLSGLLALCLPLSTLIAIHSHAEEAQPPAVVEGFTCNYNEGQDIDDLLAARDYYVKQAAKAGLEVGPAFLWSLVKGDTGIDLVWLRPHTSYAAYAAAMDAESAAPELAGVQARFDAVGDCVATLGTVNEVFTKEGADPTGPAVINSNACRLHPGMGPDHVNDLRLHMNGVLGNMGDNTPLGVYTISPFVRGADTPDLVFFSVSESHSAYGKFMGAVLNSDAGQRVGRHINMLAQCRPAVWAGQQVIDAPE